MLKKAIQKFITTWFNHEFSSWGETGSDYKSFQSQYKNIIKKICLELNKNGTRIQIDSFNSNHYSFSCVLRLETPDWFHKYIYVSVWDVRWDNWAWYVHILYRTMSHNKDWTGWANKYTSLINLGACLQNIYSY